jgi:PA14 domain
MKVIISVLVLLSLTSCEGYKEDSFYVSSPVTPIVAPDAIQVELNILNAQRQFVGQELLQPGLDCTLYTVPQTTIAIIGATLTNLGSFAYQGVFNVPNQSVSVGLPILPKTLQSVFQTWYVMKCTGTLVMGVPGWHSFSLSSDDGSNLYISGALVINNDGLHGMQTVSAVKSLTQGGYSIELDYLQGGGNEALILDMDGALLPAENLYH